MIVGVPREVKEDEYRVGMLPVGVEELTKAGHRVLVERGAGMGSGIPDEQYALEGAEIVSGPEAIFGEAELVVKVKEPMPDEWPLLRRDQMLMTYFHFAADEELTREVLDTGVTAIAYETLRGKRGDLPCLTPMSEVAGRMSIQEGAKYLERPQEGRGILLGGVPGVSPAHILVLGGGIVGKNAAQIASGFQADVVLMDVDVDRLRYLDDIMPPNVTTLFSDRHNIREQLQLADLVIGAVLIPGAKAPSLVSASDLKLMKAGAVIIDVCIDQGGCVETSRPTTHSNPTYVEEDVVHYCVTNMPGAVGRTSTYALCNVTFPYVMEIAQYGLQQACSRVAGIREAVSMYSGKLTSQPVAETFGIPFEEFQIE
ncbi:Alanine dehydrogenase [Thalassoglobus neptunius]|uniref:Alanine dehydrogenase n=1 Tax=Thalassoglobus neptunius TaxID=1938619 RepID=A0A5C5X5B0_9PLAN|nr:alanine dehydrogenase [Thalassoglobus neptunius]TWT58114.1 Alanine dehydrogenase [Thalassoglobus neptunius]